MSIETMFWVVAIVTWAFSAGASAYLASEKGRNMTAHFFGGLGFSVLWLIVAAGLPSLKDAMADPTQVPAATQETNVPEVNLSGDTSA